jgi:hypothetical protein
VYLRQAEARAWAERARLLRSTRAARPAARSLRRRAAQLMRAAADRLESPEILSG